MKFSIKSILKEVIDVVHPSASVFSPNEGHMTRVVNFVESFDTRIQLTPQMVSVCHIS